MSDPEMQRITVQSDPEIRKQLIEAIGSHIAADLLTERERRAFWRPTHWGCLGFAALAPLAITALGTAAPLPLLGVIGFIAGAASIMTGSGRTAERLSKAEQAVVRLLGMEREQQHLAILQQSNDPSVLVEVDRRCIVLNEKLAALRERGFVDPLELPPPASPPRLPSPSG